LAPAKRDDARGGRKASAATKLAESEARLAAILNTAVDAMLIGTTIQRLMPSPHRERHDDYLAAYLTTGEARIIGIGREVEGERKDGSVFPLELAVSEVKLPGRRLFTGVLRDISDRRKAEEEARRRLNQTAHTARLLELGEMATSIAHEINQPLAAIVSFAEGCLRLLRSGRAEEEVLADALQQIAEQGQRAGAIIQSLRQLARRGAAERSWIDVNQTIRDVLGLIGHQVKRGGVRVALELDAALPPVLADKVQIEQVMLNLARNAIEAMEVTERKVLSIRSYPHAPSGAGVEIAVADTGTGLPPQDAHRVFDPFFTTKQGGVGIGLAISRSIIESHGGKLGARSRPDGGAEFSFSLPVQGP
jgi:two-component system sensor kinase FixL